MLECRCLDRAHAQDVGEFVFLAHYDGWCFVDGPRRRMTLSAKSNGIVRGVESHEGEPYVWQACPWCGDDLPKPDDGEDGG